MVLLRVLLVALTMSWGPAFFGCAPAAAAAVPQPFALELRLDSLAGPLLTGPITDGRLLTAQGWVPLLGGGGETVLGNLIWQLYDEGGQAVEGHHKIRQILEVGGQEFVSFTVNTKILGNGRYYLACTHQDAARPARAFQASQAFEVRQPVAITAFWVDESSQGAVHRPVLYEDQSPHIFVSYHLAENVPSVFIQLDVFDNKGKQLATRSAFKERDPARRVSRFGVRLAPGVIPAGQKARVTAQLTAPDGALAVEEIFVEIIGLQLQVDMPAILRRGETAPFQVMVPETFVPPYTMTFPQLSGMAFDYTTGLPGVLVGSVKVGPAVALGRARLVLEVGDHTGRTAAATIDVVVEAARPGALLPAAPGPGRPLESGGDVGSSPPPF
jgi:hypothetical protein